MTSKIEPERSTSRYPAGSRGPPESAAAKAGMDPKTARKYLRSGKLPSEMPVDRNWRTREDPFNDVWEPLRDQRAVKSRPRSEDAVRHVAEGSPRAVFRRAVADTAAPGEDLAVDGRTTRRSILRAET